MADRDEIASRHGIPEQADQLVGDTPEALEADAAARAALRSMFGSLTPRVAVEEPAPPPEPESEAPLPPAGKPFDQYTNGDWQAVYAASERRLRKPKSPAEVEGVDALN